MLNHQITKRVLHALILLALLLPTGLSIFISTGHAAPGAKGPWHCHATSNGQIFISPFLWKRSDAVKAAYRTCRDKSHYPFACQIKRSECWRIQTPPPGIGYWRCLVMDVLGTHFQLASRNRYRATRMAVNSCRHLSPHPSSCYVEYCHFNRSKKS